MSNVQECIDLYLTDEEVTDAQFRAVIVDARARDMIEGNGDTLASSLGRLAVICDKLADTDEEQGRALVLLNRVDDVRRDQIEALGKEDLRLVGFIDSLAGQVRVLRERLDAIAPLMSVPERLDNLEGK